MRKSTGKNVLHYIGFLLLALVLFNVIWYVLSVSLDLKALPNPMEVYKSYDKALNDGILDHTFASLSRISIGIAIALALALVLGIMMGYNRKLNKILSPLVYFSYPLPKLAFLPIIMILFGIDDVSKIIIIVLIVVFQLLISIRDAVIHIPKEKYDVLISLHASPFQKIRHITLPAILPEVYTSLRIALGIALSALFFAETFGTDKGLGFYITDSWMRIDYIQMYFGICTLSFLGITLFIVLDIADHLTCGWKVNNDIK